jgi:hypothetical protein
MIRVLDFIVGIPVKIVGDETQTDYECEIDRGKR